MISIVLSALVALTGGGTEERTWMDGLPLSMAVPQADSRSASKTAAKDQKPSGDLFAYYAAAPLQTEHKATWHGLFNTPPLEEAYVMVPQTWHARVAIGVQKSDYSSDDGAGTTRIHTAAVMETFSADYWITDRLMVGLRLRTGEIGEGGDDPVVVFDDASQIVPDGDRSMGLESIVIRGKYVLPTSFLNLGVLLEFKIPVADEESLLTSQTVDIGLSFIATKRWAQFALTANLGVVIPAGSPDVFIIDVDANPFVTGGVEFAWQVSKPFVVIGQFEFNSSGLSDVSSLSDPCISFTAGVRARLSSLLHFTAAVGTGLTDASGGLLASVGLDFVF